MLQEALMRLDRLESEELLQEINPALGDTVFTPDNTTILAQDLEFYPGYRFLDIAEYDTAPALRRFVIYKAGDVTVLNWTNEPVYNLNGRAPLCLDDYNVGDYARFFFTYVRGRHGRFVVTENIDNIAWRESPPPAVRQTIGKMITPVTLHERRPDGSFDLSLCMMFKDSLFKSRVHVAADGTVSLSQEELLIEDMPVLDDIFGQ